MARAIRARGGSGGCGLRCATCAPTTRCSISASSREVRAVDDITLDVNRNEIYGLAGESSCGKTSFIKTIAGANRPPLNVLGGSARYSFLDRDIFRTEPGGAGRQSAGSICPTSCRAR